MIWDVKVTSSRNNGMNFVSNNYDNEETKVNHNWTKGVKLKQFCSNERIRICSDI